MDLFNDSGEISEKIRAKLNKIGWTCRARWMDNLPRRAVNGDVAYFGQLVGFRFTNADKLLWEALSIQVFDRSTVSLSFDGFTNDDHLSFTDEDGRELLKYLRQCDGTPLTQEFWDELPEAASKELQPAAMTTGKGHLVAALAKSHPHIFGRGGRISTQGTDFYEEVLSILDDRDPQPIRVAQLQSIQQLEGLAHDFYAAANNLLRSAAIVDFAFEERARHHILAVGMAHAAEECRRRAWVIRSATTEPPAADPFKDATPEINPLEILGFLANAGVTSDTPEAMRQAIRDQKAGRNAWGEKHAKQLAQDNTPAGDYQPGDLVVITDPQDARTQQIGQVKSATPTHVLVEFTAGAPKATQFMRSQLAPLDAYRQLTE